MDPVDPRMMARLGIVRPEGRVLRRITGTAARGRFMIRPGLRDDKTRHVQPAIPQVGTEVLKAAEFASVLGVGQIRGGRFSRQEAGILCNRG